MKRLFAITLSLVVGFSALSQKNSARGEQYHLIGTLKDSVPITPGCGYIAWGTVVQFEVVRITGTSYANKTIGIIVTCPEFYEKGFFVVGKTYEVIFSTKNQADFGWTVPNKDLLKKNGLSYDPYIVSIKKGS